MSLDAFKNFSIDGRAFLRLLSLWLIIIIMLLLIMIASDIIIILVGKELSKHLLDVIQGFFLSLGHLLLSVHPSLEVIIAVIGHMH